MGCVCRDDERVNRDNKFLASEQFFNTVIITARDEGFPHFLPRYFQKVVGECTADEHVVVRLQKLGEYAFFGAEFRSAHHCESGVRGRERSGEFRDLFFKQESRITREQFRDAHNGGVHAVAGVKTIFDEHLSECRELFGKRLVVLHFATITAQIFKYENIPRREIANRAACRGTDGVWTKRNIRNELPERFGYRRECLGALLA